MNGRPIVILADSPSGGAGRAAWRLFIALREQREEVEFWHFQGEAPDDHKVRRLEQKGRRPILERAIKNISKETARRMRRRRHTGALLAAVAESRPRLLHLHNLSASGLDHASLLQLPAELPLIWTLHDAWAVQPEPFRWFDAGLDREEWLSSGEAELSEARAKRERFYRAGRQLMIVAPSAWLCSLARAAVPAATPVRQIPLGLPAGVFTPMEKRLARKELGLDEATRWIGFGGWAADRRKGADVLADAMRALGAVNDAGLLAWGGAPSPIWPQEWPVRDFGRVHDDAQLRKLYAACEIFICPSRADNFPLVVLEAQACGTPVLGWVVPSGDATALAAAMRHALQTDLVTLSQAAAINGASYSSAREVAAYQSLYGEMLAAKASGA
jgi:glycosyltransferase involved in cell wall biosynthesis